MDPKIHDNTSSKIAMAKERCLLFEMLPEELICMILAWATLTQGSGHKPHRCPPIMTATCTGCITPTRVLGACILNLNVVCKLFNRITTEAHFHHNQLWCRLSYCELSYIEDNTARIIWGTFDQTPFLTANVTRLGFEFPASKISTADVYMDTITNTMKICPNLRELVIFRDELQDEAMAYVERRMEVLKYGVWLRSGTALKVGYVGVTFDEKRRQEGLSALSISDTFV